MDDLAKLLNCKNETPSEIYYALTRISVSKEEFCTKFAPLIFELQQKNEIQTELLYISLLANQNDKKYIQYFSNYEAKNTKLDLKKPHTLFNHIYANPNHWFEQFLQSNHQEVFSKEISNIFTILESCTNYNYNKKRKEDIKKKLEIVKTPENLVLKTYLKEIRKANRIIEYIKKYGSKEIEDEDIYKAIIEGRSSLEILSKYIDFKKECDNIEYLLIDHQDNEENERKEQENTKILKECAVKEPIENQRIDDESSLDKLTNKVEECAVKEAIENQGNAEECAVKKASENQRNENKSSLDKTNNEFAVKEAIENQRIENGSSLDKLTNNVEECAVKEAIENQRIEEECDVKKRNKSSLDKTNNVEECAVKEALENQRIEDESSVDKEVIENQGNEDEVNVTGALESQKNYKSNSNNTNNVCKEYAVVKKLTKSQRNQEESSLNNVLALIKNEEEQQNALTSAKNENKADISTKNIDRKQEFKDLYTEIDKYRFFIVFYNVFKIIQCKNQFESNENLIKTALFSIKNESLILEGVENIFASLFVLQEDEEQGSDAVEFICQSYKVVDHILLMLQKLIEEITKRELLINKKEKLLRLKKLSFYVSEAKYKLKIVKECKENAGKGKGKGNEVLALMLSSGEGLVNLCLSKGHFQLALEVIKIFQVQDHDLERIVCNSMEISRLRKHLFDNKHTKYTAKIIEEKLQDIPQLFNKEIYKKPKNTILKTCSKENTTTLDLLDIILTTNYSKENLVNLSEDFSSNINFFNNVTTIVKEIQNIDSIQELLLNPLYKLNIAGFETDKVLMESLKKAFDYAHNLDLEELKILPTSKELLALEEACIKFSKNNYYTKKSPFHVINYTSNLINYLQNWNNILAFTYSNKSKSSSSLVELFGSSNKKASMEASFESASSSSKESIDNFILLNTNPAEIIKNVINEEQISLSQLETLCKRFNIDLALNISKIYFPYIPLIHHSHLIDKSNVNLSLNKFKYEEFKLNLNEKPGKTEKLLKYIFGTNWILGYLLSKIYNTPYSNAESIDNRMKFFNNLLQTTYIQKLKPIFNEKDVIAALNFPNYIQQIQDYFTLNDVKQLDEEDLEKCFKIVCCEREDSLNLHELRDQLTCQLIAKKQNSTSTNSYLYVKFIKDDRIRIETILKEMKNWPAKIAFEMICDYLSDRTVDVDERQQLMQWYFLLKLHNKLVIEILPDLSWYEIHLMCVNKPDEIIKEITQTTKVDILLDFIIIFNPQEEHFAEIEANYIQRLLEANVDLNLLERLLTKIPLSQLSKQFDTRLLGVKNLQQLRFFLEQTAILQEHNLKEVNSLKISLEILQCLEANQQNQFFALVFEPLLILEVLLMNTKLDKLGEVIKAIHLKLEDVGNEEIISYEKIDCLLRKYAEKSLDFTALHGISVSTNINKQKFDVKFLLQSVESSERENSGGFNPPDSVPDKSQWVSDAEIMRCMCCKEIVFSMFNRRHHCRRCGRVICFSCSTKRLQVDGYGNIPVRVCTDCFNYESTDAVSIKSCNFWQLTNNDEDNEIIRKEFKYEYAPSSALCLAILKYHRKNAACARFLVEQCKEMLKMMKSLHSGINHRIDYKLIIRMLKSLAVAAKLYSMDVDDLNGVQEAETILKQADFYLFFIEKGYTDLLANSKSEIIDRAMLNKLRERLLADEQWNLASEVSSKVGLDKTGVFAEQGKSYLKAGKFLEAREKFKYCFKTHAQMLSNNEFTTIRSPITKDTSINTNTRPKQDPPLLKEIIKLLENCNTINLCNNKNKNENSNLSSKVNVPVLIQDKLKNLKHIAKGIVCENKPHNVEDGDNKLIYEESLYYLTNYGCFLSIIRFYIKHEKFKDGLEYVLTNNVSVEIFSQIYFDCLKNGIVDELLAEMKNIDNSLLKWKNYIQFVCRQLEIKNLSNCLYQLQIFTNDYVRCAMSCLNFYTEDVKTFKELKERSRFINKAEEHLLQALEEKEWLEITPEFDVKPIENNQLTMVLSKSKLGHYIRLLSLQKEALDILVKFDLLKTKNFIGKIPVVYDTSYGKTQIAVLLLTGAEFVRDVFNLVQEIVHLPSVNPAKTYEQAIRVFIEENKFNHVVELIQHLQSSCESFTDVIASNACLLCLELKADLKETLSIANLIKSHHERMKVYMAANQLKVAFTYAMRYGCYKELELLQKIAEEKNNNDISKMCKNVLENLPQTTKTSKKKSNNSKQASQQQSKSKFGMQLPGMKKLDIEEWIRSSVKEENQKTKGKGPDPGPSTDN